MRKDTVNKRLANSENEITKSFQFVKDRLDIIQENNEHRHRLNDERYYRDMRPVFALFEYLRLPWYRKLITRRPR